MFIFPFSFFQKLFATISLSFYSIPLKFYGTSFEKHYTRVKTMARQIAKYLGNGHLSNY